MLSEYMGILSLNENTDNIKSLTKNRLIASIPIAGRYRIIDFTLSNLANSGIKNVGIFTQSKARSLIDHVSSGKPWDLNRKIDGLFVFNFGESNTNLKDIEMIRNNMEYLYRSKKKMVIISTSSMVCNIDYEAAAKFHEQSGKDVTIIYKKIVANNPCFKDCNVLNLSKDNTVIGVGKNITFSKQNANNDLTCEGSVNLSMDMFMLSKELLINLLNNCIKTGCWIDIKNCIYDNIMNLSTNAYEFKGYLAYINSVQSYYKANMDMLNLDINKDLFFSSGLIYTKVMDEPPTKHFSSSNVCNSLISNGCLIKGTVNNSVLSRRVSIEEGAEVSNCVIMQGCTIKSNAKLNNVIVDKNNVIEENTDLKGDTDFPLVIEKRSLY
ncbi:glucose-1-phosphate adenylyltransferase [Clostridium acidisoli DSM 12555]|uniref:Glucose-1-phosphate adenylyltransferase n=1 Tax=Clostridium acidisoli DSM 12555 TaxID=1121291 RepID=A0A1W1XC10_9CLOT|nr:glucose-1-phosphate adenylyltransferase subunit GlgD [Clostridium acidisoli]SMC21413.1 glucose-1-phosphate adenylyltransferase [Clostridium acidisoli DSM 12555]